jgi:hypothetical protein
MNRSIRHVENEVYCITLPYSKRDPSKGMIQENMDFAKEGELDVFFTASMFREHLGITLSYLNSGNPPEEDIQDPASIMGRTLYLEPLLYLIIKTTPPEERHSPNFSFFYTVLKYVRDYKLTLEFGKRNDDPPAS